MHLGISMQGVFKQVSLTPGPVCSRFGGQREREREREREKRRVAAGEVKLELYKVREISRERDQRVEGILWQIHSKVRFYQNQSN